MGGVRQQMRQGSGRGEVVRWGCHGISPDRAEACDERETYKLSRNRDFSDILRDRRAARAGMGREQGVAE